MKFKDLFVPRYLHSDPEVRIKFVNRSDDAKLLKQMAEKDADANVRKAAAVRVDVLEGTQRKAA